MREITTPAFSMPKNFLIAINPMTSVHDIINLKNSQKILLSLMLIIQGTAFYLGKDYTAVGIIGLVTGISTILNLILIDVMKLSNFFWGFISAGTWVIVSIHNGLLSDVATQSFFLVMQFVGIYAWSKSMGTDIDTLAPKELSKKKGILIAIAAVILYFVLVFTTKQLNGHQVWLDASLLPLNIVGQVLMTYGFKQQWIAWIMVDILAIVIWFNQLQTLSPAAMSMLALNSIMLVNAVYGAILWFKTESKD